MGPVLFTSLLAALVTTTGIYVINKFSKWGEKNTTYFIAFAAGVLISVSFTHIVPKSFGMNHYSPFYLLIGYFSLYIFNRFLDAYVCHKTGNSKYVFGVIPAIGIGIHSFIDGVIYSVTFSVSIYTGLLAAIGMVLHEFPEGIVTFLLLVRSGFSKKKSILYAFLTAAITTPLGTLVSWPFINNLTPEILGILLSLSAGALIYVGASHLLPKIEEEKKRFSILALFVGILTALLIVFMKH